MKTVKVEVLGLRETEAALSALGKSTGKALLRRILKRRAQPMADAASANANATRRSGDLAESAAVSTKLSKPQAKKHRKMFRNMRSAVEMFVGFGPLPQAHLEEFGSVHNVARPALRPAWDAHKFGLVEGLADDLWFEIKKTAERKARRDAKRAARG